MTNLGTMDAMVLGLYFLILIGIGRYLKKRASASLADYFLGGRKMPWWLLGISSMAAWVDMTGTMIITSFLFMLGPRGLYVEFRGGACLPLIFILLWVAKWHRRSGCLTTAEWMTFRFGTGFGGNFARIASAVSMIVFTIGLLAYSFVGAGLFLSMFLPFPPWVCSLILLVVTIIYTMEAGFYGVVAADVFQMGIVVVAAISVGVLALFASRGGTPIEQLAVKITGNEGWMGALPSLHTPMPAGYENYSALTTIMLFYLCKSILQGLGQQGDPKYFGARSDRECGLQAFLCGCLMSVRWFMMMGLVVLGLYLVEKLSAEPPAFSQASALIKADFPEVEQHQWAGLISDITNHPERFSESLVGCLKGVLGEENWKAKLTLLSFQGTLDPERVLPAVVTMSLPHWLRWLMLIALLAAAMSTFNAFVNMTTGYFTNDIYKAYFRPGAPNKELIYISYLFGVVLVGISFLMAYTSKNINDIWGWLMMGMSGGLIIPLILRLYWWRFNGMGFAIGTCCGTLAAVLQRLLYPDLSEQYQLIIITMIGLIGSIVGTYSEEPTDRKVLEEFYRRTRPFGFWKPLEHLLTPQERVQTRREHRYDLIALPFTCLWQITILLAPLLLVIGSWKALGVTLAILGAALVGMYRFWYCKLPRD